MYMLLVVMHWLGFVAFHVLCQALAVSSRAAHEVVFI
jgi:hypothetical protein